MTFTSPPSTSSSSAALNLSPPPPSTTFDIVAHYNGTRKKDPSLSPPLAAMESLIALLSENPLTTIAETLALLSHQTTVLLSSQRNPIPLSAGADLFHRYIISSFQARPSFLQNADFSALRKHLISNSRLFIARAKTAATKIAAHSLPFIKEDSTIFAYASATPVISAIITATTESGRYASAAYITSPTCPNTATSPTSPASSMELPFHEVAYALSSLKPFQRQHALFIVPATAVLENGSIVAALGTHQLALLASAYGIPFYVAVESFKFVRSFPLGTGAGDLSNMGAKQPTLQFSDLDSVKNGQDSQNEPSNGEAITSDVDKIDITPPEVITALITENGTMTPHAVSEELIKLWF